VAAFGAAALHVIAFERGAAITVVTRLPLRLAAAGGWGDTTLLLAGREYLDVLTGSHITGGATSVAEILERYPVALLIPNDLPRDEVAAVPDATEPEES
jgi:(1->4)-alpha-D-glucan 1-alpha-D-glucosylmutase